MASKEGERPERGDRKGNVATSKPAVDLRTTNRKKLAENATTSGWPATGARVLIDYAAASFSSDGGAEAMAPARKAIRRARDIAVDRAGNIFVADATSVKVYAADGKFLRAIDRFMLAGKEQPLGRPFGVRASAAALYVVARLDGAAGAQLVKIRLGAEAESAALWRQPLDGQAKLVAVDESASPPIVWVGNGGGLATLTRIVDQGDRPAPPKHLGGLRKGILPGPQALALDGGADFRPGLQWGSDRPTTTVSSGSRPRKADKLYACVDKKRGLCSVSTARVDAICRRYDLDRRNPCRCRHDHTNTAAWSKKRYVAHCHRRWADGNGPARPVRPDGG